LAQSGCELILVFNARSLDCSQFTVATLQPNPATHADARVSAAIGTHRQARAGGCER